MHEVCKSQRSLMHFFVLMEWLQYFFKNEKKTNMEVKRLLIYNLGIEEVLIYGTCTF